MIPFAKREVWIDVSVPLRSGMAHWPSDPQVRIERTAKLSRGDAANVSRLSMGSHTGTHMDAPLHFLQGGRGLDELPLSAVIGPARVIGIAERSAITPKALRRHRIRRGERVLLKTRNSARCWRRSAFVKEFAHLSQEAARYLAEAGARVVGIDYLSVGGYRKDGAQVHRILLGAGVWIIEGLNLSAVKPGPYTLICLPLRIARSDGAPARAVLRPR